MRNILVYVEAAEGKAKNVGLEILTPAKVAAEGGEVIAAVIGKDVAEAAKQAIAFGADKAVVVDGAQYEVYNTDVYANALCELVKKYAPKAVFVGATADGKDLAGKAAAKMARLFLENGVSFARESTLTSHFDFTLMSEAKKKGYSIELVYIGLESSDLAWARVASRAARGGHSVPYEDVIRRFTRSLENLPKAIALADKATILDNSTQGYRLIQVAN